jgi:hypothetical protein
VPALPPYLQRSYLREVLCPPEQEKDEPSARLPLTLHLRAGGLREAGWCGVERRAGTPPGSPSYQECLLRNRAKSVMYR